MRAFLLIAGAALALGGCNRGAPTENNEAAVESLTAQNIVSNDVTAIDAVTGDAANMAADVDMNFGDLNEMGNNQAEAPTTSPARASRRTSAAAESNTARNTTITPATPPSNAE